MPGFIPVNACKIAYRETFWTNMGVGTFQKSELNSFLGFRFIPSLSRKHRDVDNAIVFYLQKYYHPKVILFSLFETFLIFAQKSIVGFRFRS